MQQSQRDNLLCIVGLGNPGKKYRNNRHNIGFQIADRYACRTGIPFGMKRSVMQYGSTVVNGGTLAVCKPMTYMNRSGEAVLKLVRKYHWEPERFLIVYDDVSIPAGVLRLRLKGSSGGHNGLRSIIDCLGTQDIPRLRVGVGAADPDEDLADYVLSDFSSAQLPQIHVVIDRACDAVTYAILHGMERTMNVFNGQMKTTQEQ